MSVINIPFSITTSPFEAIRLNPEQITQLHDIIATRDPSFPPTVAIYLLQKADYPEKYHDFQQILENEQITPSIRYQVAASLGRINTPTAVEVLINSIPNIHDQYVLGGVVKSLGRIGNDTALQPISEIKNQTTGFTASQAQFAAALISHRLCLAGNDLPIPESREYLELSTATRVFRISPATTTGVSACLQSLTDQSVGIQFSEAAYQICCGQHNWMLLFNRDFATQDAVQKLQRQKAFLGIIASKNEATGSYSIAFLLLTSPATESNKLNILIYSSGGDPIFGGVGQVVESKVEFSIRSISRQGAFPLTVEGYLESGKVEFTKALSGSIVQARQPIKNSNNLVT